MVRFYGHFAAAYGTMWLCLMLAAVVTQSHINAGAFGLYGFPVIALLYAIVRSFGSGGPSASAMELLQERVRSLEAERQVRWEVELKSNQADQGATGSSHNIKPA
jgi:hypothetical protein